MRSPLRANGRVCLCAVRKVSFAVLLLTTGSVVVSCNDRITPATPELDRQAEQAAARPAAGGEFPTDARFALELSAKGPFVPGRNIVVHYGVTSHMSSNAMVTLSAPDLVGSNPRIVKRGLSAKIEPRVRTSQSLAAEETVSGTLPLTISEPGYYRVVLSAVDTQAPMIQANDRLVQNVAHQELWLWIDEHGGFVTKGFDLGALPDTVRPFIGPRRFKPRHGQLTASSVASLGASTSAEGHASFNTVAPYQIGGNFQYYDADSAHTIQLGFGRISLDVWDEYSGHQEWSQEDYAEPAADGTFVLECPQSPDERYDYKFHLEANEINFGNYGAATLSVYSTDCGFGDFTVGPTGAYGHEFTLAVWLSNRARELYERERTTPLQIEFKSGIPYSNYNQDKIQIVTDSTGIGQHDQVWGTTGRVVLAHEYGHAFFHRALGGSMDEGSGCDDHVPYGEENTFCAWIEGFADFNAVALLGDSMYMGYNLESNASMPYAFDGIRVEGAIAAMLYDLADGANESFDQVAGSVKYVGDLVATCQILTAWWLHNSDASHIVYCAENQVDQAIQAAYFQASPLQPTAQSNSATTPTGWSVANIRSIWKRNLYDQ